METRIGIFRLIELTKIYFMFSKTHVYAELLNNIDCWNSRKTLFE